MPIFPHHSQDDFPNTSAEDFDQTFDQKADPDQRLIEFLRQNTSPPPAASPDLEERLMQEIKNVPLLVPNASSPFTIHAFMRPTQGWKRWMIPSAFVAGITAAWLGSATWQPMTSTSGESETLEAFLQENWDSLAETSPKKLEELF